jgi:regulator of cell morphogenesis and NO signaling
MTASLAELCDHIVQTHHAYLRKELPRLLGKLNKLAIQQGEEDPRLVQLRNTFARFMVDMIEHIDNEEWYVFPMARRLEQGMVEPRDPGGRDAIHAMIQEHDEGGMALLKMREFTDGFRWPDHASESYKQIMRDLEKLDRDVHEHVFKENCILALRVQQMLHQLQLEQKAHALQDVVLTI